MYIWQRCNHECVCVCVCQRKTKDRAHGMREKSAHCPRRFRTCTSGIRAHRASDYTTTAGTPCVSRNKHFRHSPGSSIVKQSCMKHSASYLRDRDVKHLQGPPLSRTKRVRERRKIELTEWRKKVPIALDGIRTCTSGIRAHRASDYTTPAGTPRVSRNKHFRHSPASSIVKQSRMCVCVCVCVCARACARVPKQGDSDFAYLMPPLRASRRALSFFSLRNISRLNIHAECLMALTSTVVNQ